MMMMMRKEEDRATAPQCDTKNYNDKTAVDCDDLHPRWYFSILCVD
jgi:hypothetical protein